MADQSALWDVIIVGAGPAGLSAALVLGRCRRRVLMLDDGTPRSWAAHEVHGFLSRDGIGQDEFRRICREQLGKYPSVDLRVAEVSSAARLPTGDFEVRITGERSERCRKVLLATGVLDELPPIPDIEYYFGISAHSCPYCDGWEMRDRLIAVYGEGERGPEMARAMTAWSPHFTLVTGGTRLGTVERHDLEANGINVIEEPIARLIGEDGWLRAIEFDSGRSLRCEALFFDTASVMQSPLASALGCPPDRSGRIDCGEYAETCVPGVFAAGNMVKGVQLSIVAAADGARAAFGINRALTRERFNERTQHRGSSRPVVSAS
jgi:thioredoxin reductase